MKFKKNILSVIIIFALISQFSSEALDIIGVKQPDGSLKLSELFVTFSEGTISKISNFFGGSKKKATVTKVEINGVTLNSLLSLNTNLDVQPTDGEMIALANEINSQNLNVNGKYKVQFLADNLDPVVSYLVMMDYNAKLIVSDIDGTITKSDLRGHLLNYLGIDWTHPGVAKLFTALYKNGYRLIYLSARPKAMVDITRKYINGVSQDQYRLPTGPIITNDADFLSATYLEVIKKRPQDFKIQCLKKIFSLFAPGAFKYGIGNKDTDSLTYFNLDLTKEQVIIINKESVLVSPESLKGKTYEQLIDVLIPKRKLRKAELSSSTSKKLKKNK